MYFAYTLSWTKTFSYISTEIHSAPRALQLTCPIMDYREWAPIAPRASYEGALTTWRPPQLLSWGWSAPVFSFPPLMLSKTALVQEIKRAVLDCAFCYRSWEEFVCLEFGSFYCSKQGIFDFKWEYIFSSDTIIECLFFSPCLSKRERMSLTWIFYFFEKNYKFSLINCVNCLSLYAAYQICTFGISF